MDSHRLRHHPEGPEISWVQTIKLTQPRVDFHLHIYCIAWTSCGTHMFLGYVTINIYIVKKWEKRVIVHTNVETPIQVGIPNFSEFWLFRNSRNSSVRPGSVPEIPNRISEFRRPLLHLITMCGGRKRHHRTCVRMTGQRYLCFLLNPFMTQFCSDWYSCRCLVDWIATEFWRWSRRTLMQIKSLNSIRFNDQISLSMFWWAGNGAHRNTIKFHFLCTYVQGMGLVKIPHWTHRTPN